MQFTYFKLLSSIFIAFLLFFSVAGCNKKDETQLNAAPVIYQPAPNLWEGLIAHYPFDGDALNASDKSLNANPNRAIKYVPGVKGQAIYMTGRGVTGTGGGHVLLPNYKFSQMKEFSLSLWVKEDGRSYPHGESYIFFGDHNAGWLGLSRFSNGPVVFKVGTKGISVPFEPGDVKKFVHYCLTYDQGTLKAYKNGELKGSQQDAVRIGINRGGLGIHWWSRGRGVSTRLIGAMDDLRIYNRALKAEEVAMLLKP